MTFDSSSDIPTGGAVIGMNVYADVLDAGNYYGAWNSTYGGQTYTDEDGNTETSPATYNPNAVATLDSEHENIIPTYFPYLQVGLNTATLRFYNAASGSSALAGTILGDPSTSFLYTNGGTQVANTTAGGYDLGSSTNGQALTNYFYVSYKPIGTSDPNSTSFSYLTSKSTVAINGSQYAQVVLGTIFFTISGGAAGQAATINTGAVTTADAGNTTFWMEDGAMMWGYATGGQTVGVIGSTAPVSVAVAGQLQDSVMSAGVSQVSSAETAAVSLAATAATSVVSTAVATPIGATTSPATAGTITPTPSNASTGVNPATAASASVVASNTSSASFVSVDLGFAGALTTTDPLGDATAVDAVLAKFWADDQAASPSAIPDGVLSVYGLGVD